MKSSNFKLSQLRMLVAVAENGNFGKAGLSLDMTQSSISHGIAALEDELGVVLLRRGRHGAHLTPVGEEIVEYARQILELSDAIAQRAQKARGLEGGTVQIAAFRSLATHVLPPIIAEFRDRIPDANISIAELSLQSDVEAAIRAGKADIGFLHLPTGQGLDAREIVRDEYVILVPPNVQLSEQDVTWEDLLSHPLILPPPNDSCSEIIRHHLEQHYQPLTVAYEIKEASTAVSMVLQGLGIAVMARLVAQPIPDMVQVFSLPVRLERLAGYAVLADALHSPALHQFLDIVKRMYPLPFCSDHPVLGKHELEVQG